MKNLLTTLTIIITLSVNAQFTYKYVNSDFDGTYRIAYCQEISGTSLLKMESSQFQIETSGQIETASQTYKHSLILALGAKEWAKLKIITNNISDRSENYTKLYGESLENLDLIEKTKNILEENIGRTVDLYIKGTYLYICDEEMYVDALFVGKEKTNSTMTATTSNDKSLLRISYDLTNETYFNDIINSNTAKFRINESYCPDKVFTFNIANIKAAYNFMSNTKNKYKKENEITEQLKETLNTNGMRELKILEIKLEKQQDSIQTAERKQQADLTAYLENEKRYQDSIQKRIKYTKDSIELKTALNEYNTSLLSIKQTLETQKVTEQKLNKIQNQREKIEFIETTFGLNTYTDLIITQQNIYNINRVILSIDTTNTLKLQEITNKIKNVKVKYVRTYWMIDEDFTQNKLRKTKLYKNNKDEFKQKKINAIQPISKHITALYVYSGGWSPYGVNITLHPFDNISFSTEYSTQGQMQTIDPNSYDNYSTQNLFDNVRQNNIYKLEDTWDANRQTLSLSLLFPVNYKKNLLIGFGMGKTITKEYKRYQLPSDFNFQIQSIKYPEYFQDQEKMSGQFYLETDKRISSNLNYNINLTLILKPITIKLGTIINDKDRRDVNINIGIGLTF
jgi:hypothetical protein